MTIKGRHIRKAMVEWRRNSCRNPRFADEGRPTLRNAGTAGAHVVWTVSAMSVPLTLRLV
jgi:hypothetical protein